MGHDIHFLERLERLRDDRQLDLALALYRDPQAVRSALEDAKLGDDVERVAIALDEGRGAPHVIVSRDGGFVTCLGAGMRVQHRVVPRQAAVAAIEASQRATRVSDRIEMRGGVHRLFSRLVEAGARLALEDFEALHAVAPLFPAVLGELSVGLHHQIALVRRSFRARDLKRRDPATEAVLRRYMQSVEAIGHLMVLMGGTIGEQLARTAEEIESPLHALTGPAFVTMESGPMIRGAWLAGEIGGRLSQPFRLQWRAAETFIEAAQAAMSLAAIARRHPEFAPSVRGVLADRSAPVFDTARSQPGDIPAATTLVESLLLALERPADIERALQQMAALGAEVPEGMAAPTVDDFPMHELGPFLLAQSRPAFGKAEVLLMMAWLTVWAAPQPATALYLPASWVRVVPTKPEVDRARESIRVNQYYFGRRQPARRATAKVGRNAPCPCGSGRKSKACCGTRA